MSEQPGGGLPLLLSLGGRRVVVVGGGPVAARKVRSCLTAGADDVLVIAPFACEAIVADHRAGLLTWADREYRAGDLTGAWLAVAATGDRAVDTAVGAEAEAARVFCIRAATAASATADVTGGVPTDATAGGSARSPAVVRRDDLVVGVSSTGRADPRRVTAIRDAIAQALDRGDLPLRRQREGLGGVVLVGGGPGDTDLLTLRARRELAAADVVVVDRLAPQGVLDELGPAVLVLDVGKAPGRHPVPQHEINRLLVEHAQAGRRVVRLKGGDPYLLGRGGEEVAACQAAGVAVTVIPGVPSAFAVPAAAGIPVTHRGLARQVTVLSGHDALDGTVDWRALAAGGGTLVVLMGVRALPLITGGLLAAGIDPQLPVAIIENGCTPAQRVVTGTVDGIVGAARAAEVVSPAVIVIGAVAAFAR